jgi:SAM-dependent methyltransferase
MDVVAYNRTAWGAEVDRGNEWTLPVSADAVARARRGEYALLLTPTKPVPAAWLGGVARQKVLCLAGGGGQQGPIFAALGASVTVFDNCEKQLAGDAFVAARDGLCIALEQGDMRDLGRFGDGAFDMVFHPVSNCFVPEIARVWAECFRVLKPGGRLLSGFVNPLAYIFDMEQWAKGNLVVRHRIPYADAGLPQAELDGILARGEPLEFGHSLESQIGGQLQAGFLLSGLYEDGSGRGQDGLLDSYIDTFIATLALKPQDGASTP